MITVNGIHIEPKTKFCYPDWNNFSSWIIDVIKYHKKKPGQILYNFIGEKKMLTLNNTLLNHDDYTDIITIPLDFPLTLGDVHGEIYVNTRRVSQNALQWKVSKEEEFLRVTAHGVLHLLGFNDKTPKDKKQMRLEEDLAITRWCFTWNSPVYVPRET